MDEFGTCFGRYFENFTKYLVLYELKLMLVRWVNTGKFLDGTSKKVCKRITNLSKFYIYSNNKLWHRETENSTEIREIPKPEERKELILYYHSFGHYNPKATLDAMKDK